MKNTILLFMYDLPHLSENLYCYPFRGFFVSQCVSVSISESEYHCVSVIASIFVLYQYNYFYKSHFMSVFGKKKAVKTNTYNLIPLLSNGHKKYLSQ